MIHGLRSNYTHGICRCEACREAERAYQRNYRQQNRERLNAYDRQPHRNTALRDDPVKRAARQKARDNIRGPQPCEVCGEPGQRHHDDYSKPLEIRWLCTTHHGIAHATAG